MAIPINMTPGHCLDCKAPVVSGPMDGEYTIVHSGTGCEGFRRRFGGVGATRAMDSAGQVVNVGNKKQPGLNAGKWEDK